MHRRRAVVAAATAVLTLGAALSVVGQASAGTGLAPERLPLGGSASGTVTLVTGDKVHLTSGPDGDVVAGVERAPGRENVSFQYRKSTGSKGVEYTVLPSDAVPLLAAGQLDARLFNVTALAREGYAGKPLPLIVTYTQGVAARAAAPAATRSLPSINGAALRPDARQAPEVWRWLTGAPSAAPTKATSLASGLSKVWLNGRKHVTLDVSVPQIGAPTAWAAGLTGVGVTVGILDTGVKGDHPDLVGKVVEQRDFTDTLPDGGDDDGHGTHVAGIIAGTGAASNGRFKGVAPDAKVVVGKVCVEGGDCPDDAIIAGMEWIAPQVKAVNMSLGGGSSDGTDPMDIALNNLTAQHGTLFIVAAGNSRGADFVGSPASADAALAVGSVTKQDETSFFSSAGPRVGDFAVKPDIAAPGSDIVAARAAGTPTGDAAPVDANYTRLSGTSMATPHVVGAAAIVVQQHPDWTATQIKPTLMSTAKPTAGVFDQGAGRVDVARAVTQKVTATGGSLNYGIFTWPHTQPAVTRTASYRNDGDTAVTLALSLSVTDQDGKPAPAGLFKTTTAQVTVPAHGTADAGVTITPIAAAVGQFGGRLTATATGITVQTALAAFLEPESFNLTVNVVTRGEFRFMFGATLDVATGHIGDIFEFGTPSAVVRLPKGRHDIYLLTGSADPTNTAQPSIRTVMAKTGIRLDRDRTVTLDGSGAKPVSAVVDRAGAVRQFSSYDVAGTSANGISTGAGADAGTTTQILAVPTGRVTDHPFGFFFRPIMATQRPGTDPAGFVYNLTFVKLGQIPGNLTFKVADKDLAVVDARYFTQGAATRASRASASRLPIIGTGLFPIFPQTVPSRRTELYTARPDISYLDLLFLDTEESVGVEQQSSRQFYKVGRQEANWNRAPVGPAFGDPALGFGVIREGKQLSVAVPLISGNDPKQYSLLSDEVTGTTTLSRDGTVVGTSDQPGFGKFTIADTAGTYTLRATAERIVPWSVIGTEADITWRFREPGATAAVKPLPLLVVRATTPVDGQGRARAGRTADLSLLVQRQPGSTARPVVELRVQASFDDGRTWTTVRVDCGGDTGVAHVPHPNANGFVSLRITARDSGGNSVTQTVIRAYQTVQ